MNRKWWRYGQNGRIHHFSTYLGHLWADLGVSGLVLMSKCVDFVYEHFALFRFLIDRPNFILWLERVKISATGIRFAILHGLIYLLHRHL